MKNKFYNLFIFFVLTALAGCNEKESTDVIEQGDPQIIEFTPTSGKFGQEITIKGELLADREEPLRIRMVVPDPGCPSPGTISKPGTFPVSIS